MAGLMARCDELGAIVANPNLALGDTIRIVSGPFAETIGKIERVTDNERVQILMELMGQTTRVLVRKSHLEKL
jgi:transcriptional antiterminator RfaH